ncbi:type II toxin-antitoxin system VapC family toxin [Spirosoma harenae]
MTYLLDTHTLIWAITNPKKLSSVVKTILENPDNDIIVSAISFWEISLKQGIRRVTLEGLEPNDFRKAAIQIGFHVLDLDGETAASYHHLSATYHRDPFDRMLICQAIQHSYCLVSKDEKVLKYASEGLAVIW